MTILLNSVLYSSKSLREHFKCSIMLVMGCFCSVSDISRTINLLLFFLELLLTAVSSVGFFLLLVDGVGVGGGVGAAADFLLETDTLVDIFMDS